MRKLIVGGIALVAASAGSARAECNVMRFRFFPAVQSESTMTVTSGRNCGVILHAGGRSRFDAVGIVQRPQHGPLSPRSGVGVTYRSSPGYKGADSFTFTVKGSMSGGNGTATIRIGVSVI